jgi:hypothetical protein
VDGKVLPDASRPSSNGLNSSARIGPALPMSASSETGQLIKDLTAFEISCLSDCRSRFLNLGCDAGFPVNDLHSLKATRMADEELHA